MAISFYPKPGMVLICNYDTGFMPPEMVKIRRVVVISPHRMNKNLCIVAPVSTTHPLPELAHHVRFEAASYSCFHDHKTSWVKCDVLNTVALHRLDRIRIHGRYTTPMLSLDDLIRVRRAAASAIGFEFDKT